MISERVLANGTRVLMEPVPETGILSTGFWFDVGSRHEPQGRHGFTHFVEHMLFKGTASRSARDIAGAIDRVGGYLNAFTERDSLCLHCTIPRSRAKLAIDVLCDMIVSSSFDGNEFLKERNVIVNEILSAQDDPEDISFDEFLESIWPGQDISRKIAGEAVEIRMAERESLYAWYKSVIVPERLLVCVSGSFEEAEILSALESGLSGFGKERDAGNASCVAVKPLVVPQERKFKEWRKADIQQVLLYAGKALPPCAESPEYYAHLVFNCLFGDSMSSRLFQNIRENTGYCYSVYSSFVLSKAGGLWMVAGASTCEDFESFHDALLAEFGKVSSCGIDDAEIRDARGHLEGAMRIASEDAEHRMKRIARQYAFNGRIVELEDSFAELRGVPDDLVRAAGARLCDAASLSYFAYGSKRKGREWKKSVL